MKNTSHNPRFPRKARPSSRTRFGGQAGAPQKSWGKTHFGKIEGSAAVRDARRPIHTDTSRPAAPFTKTPRLKGPSPIPTRAPGEFPMRINKYLAWKGYATRQGADEMIKRRAVTLNGRLAILGDQVQETDVVELRSNRQPETYIYYAYNKPRGITTEPTLRGKDISQSITLKGVFPVGGLDVNSEGLVILTNDRRIVNRLLNPAHAHMKEYLVRTVNPVKPNFKEKMESGIVLEHGRGRGAKRTADGAQTNIPAEMPIQCNVHMMRENLFSIRVTENDSRVRQMCSLFFAEIENLTRTEVLNIRLEKLPPNSYRRIEGDELEVFLSSLGL